MSVHQYDDKMRSDTEFIPGCPKYLVVGNHCRLLDGRRTTGYIEAYFEESAMFRWRITKYEDKGKYWDVPAEDVVRFQFEKNATVLNKEAINDINEQIEMYSEEMIIEMNQSNKDDTHQSIESLKKDVLNWLNEHSLFFQSDERIDFDSSDGSALLARDLKNYMISVNLELEETLTAKLMVLNPNSGEWIKGMCIVLAEMGLAPYKGKIPRTHDIFLGVGEKENRRRYLMHRLAFIRAYYSLLQLKEVVVYRGMSNEGSWKELPRTLLPCTFDLEVAKAFSDFSRDSKYMISYLVKMTCQIEQLFMTHLETGEMNNQYKEAETILLYDQTITL